MSRLLLYLYFSVAFLTFIFLTLFHGAHYTWWNWPLLLFGNWMTGLSWPLYWAFWHWQEPVAERQSLRDETQETFAVAAAEAFVTICASPDFSYDAAVSMAEHERWRSLPRPVIELHQPNVGSFESKGWLVADKQQYPVSMFLFASKGRDGADQPAEVCTQYFALADAQGVITALRANHSALVVSDEGVRGQRVTTLSLPGEPALGVAVAADESAGVILQAAHKK